MFVIFFGAALIVFLLFGFGILLFGGGVKNDSQPQRHSAQREDAFGSRNHRDFWRH